MNLVDEPGTVKTLGVIPAKAGIQYPPGALDDWLPAFAGMTSEWL
jgi:hypothetical protein